ncbi:SDR family NAD(P)-dependent oxidoreductase [Natronomonas sp.]|uniref:SDR family NAD(P)-dependent oxidoreductase n=1 Tax=Natronomonas sp. TaxID=2184060 RepID=UPI002606AB0C|nr:SDR family oxidoreductase [Natronomonas sp.]
MPNLSGVSAFVTGASGGIGEEIAVTLSEYGANVAIAARSDGIYDTADRIGTDAALALETDVTDEQSVAESIESTVAEFGGLDVLVNNAGAMGPTAPVEEIDADAWRAMTDVKVFGPFVCMKHAAEHLRESDRGTVVNVSSIGGKRPYPNRSPYAASNMAMIGMSRTWAHELGEDGVTVNSICPGPVEGDRIERVIQAQADEQGRPSEEVREEDFYADLAIAEFVTPGDVAELIAYLASDAGRHITAQDLNVDSGATWY